MRITVYPRNICHNEIQVNPYIRDFIGAMEQNGATVANPPHKNPLFSLLGGRPDSDVYIFHWLENVPDYKYGMLQTMAAVWFILKIKLSKRKLVWFLHNKQPHTTKHRWAKRGLIRLLMRKADLIVTHATEGLAVVYEQCPPAVSKAVFFHHPTKNRLTLPANMAEERSNTTNARAPKEDSSPQTDLLIWGNISAYKGVPEFVRFATEKQLSLKTRIIGRCSSQELFADISRLANPYITIENRSISFDELSREIQQSRFVLIPYASESILSSGILMDSLSFGAKVIGPSVGSFRDYATEPLVKVYTFDRFEDIPVIFQNNVPVKADPAHYADFLDTHSWETFGKIFTNKLQSIL